MSGGQAGSALGGIAGSLIAPGVGTVIGSSLGGLAGGTLGGGGGSAPAGAGGNPATSGGAAAAYQPQQQAAYDQSFQNILSTLYNPAFAGAQQVTGNPATELYPRAAGVGQWLTASETPGTFGQGGARAYQSALDASNTYQSLFNAGQTGAQWGTAAGQAGLGAIPQVQQAAFDPMYGQATQNIAYNPYFGQAMGGAQGGAYIGGGIAGLTPTWVDALQQSGYGLPGMAQQYSGMTTSGIPTLQGLQGGSAQRAGDYSGQALGLQGGTQALMGATVPGLAGAAPYYAGQAGQIAQQQAGLAGQAQQTTPQLQQLYQSIVPGLVAGGSQFAEEARGMTPWLQGQIGGNVQAMDRLAGQSGALAGPYAQQLQQAYQPLGQGARDILQTGFDPQSALYNRTAQQLRDQQQAINAQTGVGTSPYGAGVTGKTMSDFNIDWQNQQLGRQAQALGAAGTATGLLPGFQQQGLAGLGEAQRQAGASAAPATALAQQQLAATLGGGDIYSRLLQAAGTQGQGLSGQQLQNTLGAGQLTRDQIASMLGGGQLYGNLLDQGGRLGLQGQQQQLNEITGAGGIYNQLAQGAGTLGTDVGQLANQGFNQNLNAATSQAELLRQALGIGAGGSALAATAGGLPYGAYQSQQANLLNALGQRAQAAQTGTAGLGNLGNLLQSAGGQQIAGLQAGADFGAAPYDVTQTQGANALNTLRNQLALGQAQFELPQQVLGNIQNYMTLGQNASNLSGLLGARGFSQNQQQLGNIGGLANSLLGQGGSGSNLLFGSQGLGGALGINPQQGLLGNIFGGGNTTGFMTPDTGELLQGGFSTGSIF